MLECFRTLNATVLLSAHAEDTLPLWDETFSCPAVLSFGEHTEEAVRSPNVFSRPRCTLRGEILARFLWFFFSQLAQGSQADGVQLPQTGPFRLSSAEERQVLLGLATFLTLTLPLILKRSLEFIQETLCGVEISQEKFQWLVTKGTSDEANVTCSPNPISFDSRTRS